MTVNTTYKQFETISLFGFKIKMKFILVTFLELGFAQRANDELNREERGPPGVPGSTSSGPLSVWYGESGIASVTTRNGDLGADWKVENMFDENAGTCWHNDLRFLNLPKSVRVDFYVSKMIFGCLLTPQGQLSLQGTFVF